MLNGINHLGGKSFYASSLTNTYEPHVLRGAWFLILASYSAADVIEVKDFGSAGTVELDTNANQEIDVFLGQIRESIVSDACFTHGPIHTYPLAERCLQGENVNFKTAICHETADYSQLGTCHIVLVIKERSINVSVEESLSSSKHDPTLPKRLVGQLETVAAQLQEVGHGSTIGTVDFMGPYDWEDAASHEIPYPQVNRNTLHSMMLENSLPGWQAIEAWDGSLTYAELDHASSVVARTLQEAGACRGSYVPLFFEKSVWHPVAVFACSKIGAPWVTIPFDMPLGRVQSIIDQLKGNGDQMGQVCLSSVGQRDKAASFIQTVIQVEGNMFSSAKVNGNHTDCTIHGHDDARSHAEEWRDVQPEDCAYVAFTSGTTGVPKGILITQENMCSFIPSWVALRGHPGGPGIRDGHILSYASDVSILEILVCLCMGSCLCILSEDERMNDLGPALARNGVTHLHITPSLSEVLDPADLPALRHIHFAGEWMTQALVNRWLPSVEVLATYGPTEITNECCGLRVLRAADFGNGCIGRPFGSRMYIVNPDNPHQRLPRGFVGEMIVEGPGVSAGYLANPEATADAFVEDLTWAPAVDGKPRRFYRTGDIGYMDADGLFFCRGRRDLQVKIRGQRIELAEVEHHIRTFMPAGARVVVDTAMLRTGITTLTAFLKVDDKLTVSRSAFMESLKKYLLDHLPPIFVPSSFLFIDRIPLGNTGKADRRKLRAMAETNSMDPLHIKTPEPDRTELVALNNAGGQATITNGGSHAFEEELRELWATVLCLREEEIDAESNFFGLGGDSIAAMKLVSLAKKKSIPLTSAQILKSPTLRALVAAIGPISRPPTIARSTSLESSQSLTLAPFPARPLQVAGTHSTSYATDEFLPVSGNYVNESSPQRLAGENDSSLARSPMNKFEKHVTPALLVNNSGRSDSTNRSSSREPFLNGGPNGHSQSHQANRQNRNDIAASWAIAPECIEDVANATPLQQSLFAPPNCKVGAHILQWEFRLPSSVMLQRLCGAWQRVVDRNPILRTRFFRSSAALLQVVLADDFHWEVRLDAISADARIRLRQDMAKVGSHLSDLTVFRTSGGDKQALVWTVHSALMDEYAARLIMNAVDKAYKGHVIPQLESFSSFSLNLSMPITDAEKTYWETTLEGCQAVVFPAVSGPDQAIRASANLSRVIPGSYIVSTVLLRAAWALTVAKMTGTDDVVFGAVVSGRNDTRLMNVAGPLRNIVPARFQVNRAVQVSDFIEQVHKGMVATEPFAHIHTSQIASISPELRRACQFQNILDVHTSDSETGLIVPDGLSWAESIEQQPLQESAYALAIGCFIEPQRVRLVAQYDNYIIKEVTVGEVLEHLADTLQGLGSAVSGSTLQNVFEKELPADTTPSAFTFYRTPSPETQPGTPTNKMEAPVFPDWALAQLRVDTTVIEDLTPATPFQNEIIGGMIQTPGAGTFLRRYPILPDMDCGRLSKAWDLVCAAMPCMRTRVVWSPEDNSGHLVTLSTWSGMNIVNHESLPAAEAWINTLRIEAGSLGSALARAAVIHVTGYPSIFVYAMSHCVYDRSSLDVVWDALCDGYWSGRITQTLLPYRCLTDHLGSIDPAPAKAFWSRYLDGAPSTIFPVNPTPGYMTCPASSVSLVIPILRNRGSPITMATLVRAAWGLTIGSYTGSADVVFRALLSGRTAVLDEIERVCGPTLTNVPIRIRTTDQSLSVAAFLAQVQEDGADILEHETLGLDGIAKLNPEAGRICSSFNNHLVVHPMDTPSESRPLPLGPESIIMDMTGYVAFVLTCSLDVDKVVASTIHDPIVVDDVAAQGVLARFHGFLDALTSAERKTDVMICALMSMSEQRMEN
ncbi:hypothetical protein F5Y06DRAFT_17429 [Hypoxylon sp. FL0890]|nr:hypothetical protein F5Y06DRAFT_17429 [Hypoxylon sp. FL0890]